MIDTVINLQDFKDGVADGLLKGNRKDGRLSDAYKQGYDFGIVLYNKNIDKLVRMDVDEKE